MQFKVPQDVQQADRIVSFLTLQQLIMCVVGGGFAYAVYTILHKQGLPAIFWIPPVGIILLLTAAFAFLKIANLPFYKYLIVLIERLIMPNRRVWIKGADRVISDEAYVSPEEQKAKEKEEQSKAMIEEKEAQLKGIGSVMEAVERRKPALRSASEITAQAPEGQRAELKEIEETPDEKLLQKAFLEKPAPSSTPPNPSAPLPQAPLAEKKKRKRKRKRKNLGVITGQVQPVSTSPATQPPAPAIVPKTPASPVTQPPPSPAVVRAPSPPEAPTPAIIPQPEPPVSNAPVAPELELIEVAPEPLVVQEKEELMIPEEPVLLPTSVSPPSPPQAQSPSLQAQGEFTADQLRAGATLQIPNS